jgi:LysR family glycine cleavage system transcriptional activator
MPRPPPLQLLPAFEAASRLLSFSKAAQELHVTTAAVSQQIKQLEARLGLPLFQRLPRRVELTEAGREFAQVVSQALATYRQGHARLMHKHSRPVLRMSMTPLVAHELLIPNLARFQAAHPDVDVRLDASMDIVDFNHAAVDAAIRVGTGHWPGLKVWPLCDCEVRILASPALLRRHPIRDLADLRHHTLIHPRQSHLDWDAVAHFAEVDRIERKGDLVLDSDLAAVRAAEQGLGVTLCLLPAGAAQAMLKLEQLTSVFPPFRLRAAKAYFVFRPHSGKEALLQSAYEWIKRQIEFIS